MTRRVKTPPLSIGYRHGLLVVIGASARVGRRLVYPCKCDCGMSATVLACYLIPTSKRTVRSCGCLRDRTTHGHAGNNAGLRPSSTYASWGRMVGRCTTPSDANYRDYGGRGIRVCERWLKFENFLTDMGERPHGLSIDRIDNNDDYEPFNCRWATNEEQSLNRRNTLMASVGGVTKPLMVWCRDLGIRFDTVRSRMGRGWSDEDALTVQLYERRAK